MLNMFTNNVIYVPRCTKIKKNVKQGRRSQRYCRKTPWKFHVQSNDPVKAPTASELEAADGMLKLLRGTYYKNKKRKLNKNNLNHHKRIKYEHKKDDFSNHSSTSLTLMTLDRIEQIYQDHDDHSFDVNHYSNNHPRYEKTLAIIPEYLKQTSSSSSSSKNSFHTTLDTLEMAACRVNEMMKSGNIPKFLMSQLLSCVPPIVFKAEFYDEIERVRNGAHYQSISIHNANNVPLYTTTTSHTTTSTISISTNSSN